MVTGLSEHDRAAIERFRRRAQAAEGGGLADRIKALGDEGLVNLVSRDRGWRLALEALRAVVELDPALARAAAVNLVAADLIYRWARCDNLRVLEPIVKGRGIAALAGPGDGPDAPALNATHGRLVLTGRSERVWLAPMADVIVVMARSGDGVAVLALARDEAGLELGAEVVDNDARGIPCAGIVFNGVEIYRVHLVGLNPLPDSEPDGLTIRLTQALDAAGFISSPSPGP